MSETLVINGQAITGDRIQVVTQNEQWSEWILEDGAVLRSRPALIKVLKIPVETGAQYVYSINNVTDIVPSKPGQVGGERHAIGQ